MGGLMEGGGVTLRCRCVCVLEEEEEDFFYFSRTWWGQQEGRVSWVLFFLCCCGRAEHCTDAGRGGPGAKRSRQRTTKLWLGKKVQGRRGLSLSFLFSISQPWKPNLGGLLAGGLALLGARGRGIFPVVAGVRTEGPRLAVVAPQLSGIPPMVVVEEEASRSADEDVLSARERRRCG